MSICHWFELVLRSQGKSSKSKAMFLENWAKQSFNPFTVGTDYLKDLGIWFGEGVGAGVCVKTWEERTAKVRQKLIFWEHCSFSIAGKNPVIRTHTKTNINCAWRTINSVKDALWFVQHLLVFQSKEWTLTDSCELAHSKVQDCVLRDALKLGATATKAHWGKIISGLSTEVEYGFVGYWTLPL
eukprot:g39975.t1